jgi:class 3 adenylate cyclase
MFCDCDVVDSTKLSGQLDPEEYRDVLRAYQAACVEAIQRFDGYIAQHLGDGLLVYFGFPTAMQRPSSSASTCTNASRLRTDPSPHHSHCVLRSTNTHGNGPSSRPPIIGSSTSSFLLLSNKRAPAVAALPSSRTPPRRNPSHR